MDFDIQEGIKEASMSAAAGGAINYVGSRFLFGSGGGDATILGSRFGRPAATAVGVSGAIFVSELVGAVLKSNDSDILRSLGMIAVPTAAGLASVGINSTLVQPAEYTGQPNPSMLASFANGAVSNILGRYAVQTFVLPGGFKTLHQ